MKYKVGRSLQKEDSKKYEETAEKIFKFYLDGFKIIFWGVNSPFYSLRENLIKLIKNKNLNDKFISVDTNELKKKVAFHEDIFLSPDQLFKYLNKSNQKHLFVITAYGYHKKIFSKIRRYNAIFYTYNSIAKNPLILIR